MAWFLLESMANPLVSGRYDIQNILLMEAGMPDQVVLLMRRARNCPIACSLKILFVLLLVAALYIAIYHQTSVSLPWYLLFLGIIAVESALMLFANNQCRTRVGESSD